MLATLTTISGLLGKSGGVATKSAFVAGYHASGDGGGGIFTWSASTSKSSHNGGTIIDPSKTGTVGDDSWWTSESSGLGCWVRQYDGDVSVKWFGAKGDNSNASAANNEKAIKAAIKFVTASTGVLFFPAGTYFTNELLASDGVDFRNVSFRGEGPRRSILKLANGRSAPLIETDLWFECSARDIQFNGNKANCPGSPSVMHLSTGNVYALRFDNVYFRDGAGDGLLVEGGQHFTLTHCLGKFCDGWGLRFNLSEGVVIDHPDCEQNGEGGILLQADSFTSQANYRYFSPGIFVANPYLEANPVGVELRGICGVEVVNGYRYQGTFLKISSAGGVYSHGNRLRGTWAGKVIIEDGCYGNVIDTPSLTGVNEVDDKDGRNAIGTAPALFAADKESRNYSANPVGGNITTNMSLWVLTAGSGHVWSLVDASVLDAEMAYNAAEDGPRSARVAVNGAAGSSISFNPTEAWPTNSTAYVYALLRVKGGARLSLQLYDLNDPGYYNFATKQWQASTALETSLLIPTTGDVQYLKIPVPLDATARRWRPRFTVAGNGSTLGQADFYYCCTSDADDMGMLHYLDGVLIGRGDTPP